MAYLQGFIGLLDVLNLHFGSAYKKINQCAGKEGNRIKSDLDVLLLFLGSKKMYIYTLSLPPSIFNR